MLFVSALLSSPVLAAPEPVMAPADEAVYKMVEGLSFTPTMKVTNKGKGKKKLVKFAPKSGSEQAYETVTSQAIAMSMTGPDGETMEVPGLDQLAPTIAVSMHNRVGKRMENGLVPIQVDYLNTAVSGVPPVMKAQLEATMGSMIGFRMLVDAKTGQVEQVDVDSSDQVMFELMQTVVDSAVTQMPSFPTEPVAVGATWTVDFDMNMGGMNLLAHQNVELVGFDGSSAELAYTFTMDRGEGDIAIPGLPPGAKAEFTSFSGLGSGTQTVNLDNLSSVGSSTFEVKLDMLLAAEDRPSMEMGMSMTQVVETRHTK